jgi:hypothetical protein
MDALTFNGLSREEADLVYDMNESCLNGQPRERVMTALLILVYVGLDAIAGDDDERFDKEVDNVAEHLRKTHRGRRLAEECRLQ